MCPIVLTVSILCLYLLLTLVTLQDLRGLHPTSLGRIASFYYLSHQTMQHFQHNLRHDLNLEQLLHVLSDAYEYDELPVRHNEDALNG